MLAIQGPKSSTLFSCFSFAKEHMRAAFQEHLDPGGRFDPMRSDCSALEIMVHWLDVHGERQSQTAKLLVHISFSIRSKPWLLISSQASTTKISSTVPFGRFQCQLGVDTRDLSTGWISLKKEGYFYRPKIILLKGVLARFWGFRVRKRVAPFFKKSGNPFLAMK